MPKVALILCLLLAILVMPACAQTPDLSEGDTTASTEAPPPATEAPTEEETQVPDAPLTFVENEAYRFCIVYPDDVNHVNILIAAAEELSGFLRAATRLHGLQVVRESQAPSDLNRVYIGVLPEGEEEDVQKLTYGSWIIRRVEEDLYIYGYSAAALTDASTVFAEMVKSSYRDGNAVLTAYTTQGADQTSAMSFLPICKLQDVWRVRSFSVGTSPSCIQYYFEDISEFRAADYFDALRGADLTEHSYSEVGNATFGTYLHEGVAAYYVAYHSGVLRINMMQIRDAFVPAHVDQPSYTEVCDTKGYMMGVGTSGEPHEFQNGLCLFYLLGDGSFLIYDGGQGSMDAWKLYQLLGEVAEENGIDQIRVSAWIITHAHGDHMGFFRSFMENYANQVQIDMLMFNTSTPAQGDGYAGMYSAERSVVNLTKQYSPKTKLVRLHTGQRFYLADVLVEVIFTTADHLPGRAMPGADDGNGASTVTRLTIDGKTVLMTGDANNNHCNAMVAAYSGGLRSDFVQTPHHGVHDGATVSFYQHVAPTYALFTCGDSLYSSHAKPQQATKWLLENVDADKVYLAGVHTREKTRLTEINFETMEITVYKSR